MNVSEKYLTPEQPLKPPAEINLGSPVTSISNVAVKTLPEEGCITEKPKHEWGDVVVLVGTSTAGKTSIISELIKQKPEISERGIDLAWASVPMNYLNKNHEQEMAFLKSVIEPTKDDTQNSNYLLTYVDPPGKEPHFKEGVSIEKKEQYQQVVKKLNDALIIAIPGNSSEEYANSIVNCMMDEIILDAKQGRPTACDILQVHDVALETLKIQLPSVKFALVYVPFQTLAERVIIRNNEAISEKNLGNARLGVFPLEQFTKLFRPRNDNDLDSEIVQKLTLGEVNHAIDTVYENGKNFKKIYDPESLDQFEKDTLLSKSIIFEKFGFKEGDDSNKMVELTPSYKGYHMLINTASVEKSKSEIVQDAIKQILFK